MRCALPGTVPIAALAASRLAAFTTANATVSDPFGSGSPPGTLTLGGTTGTLSGSHWTMTVAGRMFARGTYDRAHHPRRMSVRGGELGQLAPSRAPDRRAEGTRHRVG